MQAFIKLFGDFGVQPILLLAQVVNFAILVFLLKLVLYKPMRRMLDERKAKIAKGLEDAQKAAGQLDEAEEKVEKLIGRAQKRSDEIVAAAKTSAQEILTQAKTKSEEETRRVKDEAVAEIEAQKEASLRAIRSEAGRLAVEVSARALARNLSDQEKHELVEDARKEVAPL